jgi:hypothetical protein
MRVCAYVCMYKSYQVSHLHAYIHTYIHTDMFPTIIWQLRGVILCVCVHMYVCMYKSYQVVHLHTYIHTYGYVPLQSSGPALAPIRGESCIHTHIHTHIHAYRYVPYNLVDQLLRQLEEKAALLARSRDVDGNQLVRLCGIYLYVCMYVQYTCMYVCMCNIPVCMYVQYTCMYVCMYVCMYESCLTC